MIKIGDIVRVINYGETYPTYKSFFAENKIEHFRALYKDGECLSNNNIGVVKFIGTHCASGMYICVIQLLFSDKIFLISPRGLKVFEYNENYPKDIEVIRKIYSSKSDSIIKINNNPVKYITAEEDDYYYDEYDGREDEDEDYWDV